MIADKCRAGWFGASDTYFICGNYKTKTFLNWWLEKLDFKSLDINTPAMMAGTIYEHKILEALNIPSLEFDKQIIVEDLRLRVNLDGNTKDTIYECKTYKNNKLFKPSKRYIQQVNVQMYATGFRKAYIVAYPFTEEYYKNYFLDIEKEKIEYFQINYDEKFICEEYLPKLKYLRDCLIKGVLPKEVIESI